MSDRFKDFKFKNKVIIFRDNPRFGEGPARIMNLVRETSKLSEVYKIMGLSSSKGWRIIKEAEEDLGFELFTTVIGGKDGGRTELSEEGEVFLNKYNDFVRELNSKSEKIFNKYFPD